MRDRPPDLAILIRALNEADVRYVLIGGLALILHGGTNVTFDGDLAISFDAENRRKLVSALAPFDPKPVRTRLGASWVWDELSVRAPWTILDTDVGRVDLIVRLPGVESFAELHRRSVEMLVDDVAIRVASLDDLIAMKQSSDRAKDRLHLMELVAIRELHEEGLS